MKSSIVKSAIIAATMAISIGAIAAFNRMRTEAVMSDYVSANKIVIVDQSAVTFRLNSFGTYEMPILYTTLDKSKGGTLVIRQSIFTGRILNHNL